MENFKIYSTIHDDVYDGSKLYGKDHIYHAVTSYNNIIINDNIELYAQYQTGGYEHDYNKPSNDFRLQKEYSNNIIVILDDLYDILGDNPINLDYSYILEKFEEIKEECSEIDTLEKMRELYLVVINNYPEPLEFSDNINDYSEDQLNIM